MPTLQRLSNFELAFQANSLLIKTKQQSSNELESSLIEFSKEIADILKSNYKEAKITSKNIPNPFTCILQRHQVIITTNLNTTNINIHIDLISNSILINNKKSNSENNLNYVSKLLKKILASLKDQTASIHLVEIK
jgi:hypothetical protein